MAEPAGEDLELSETDVRDMQSFARLSEVDRDQLNSLRSEFAAIATDVIANFYDHLSAHPQVTGFLRDPAIVARLKRLQLTHLSEFFGGDYGVDYCRRRLQVGRSHDWIGLEPQQAIGAYNVLLQLCCEHLSPLLGGQLHPAFLSLAKILLFDAGLTIQAYHTASVQRLRRRNDELERALRLYHETELKANGFARLAGHEIRNSLNAIANACDEVAEDYQGELPTEAAETVKAASERAWQLVDVVEQILSSPEVGGNPQWVEATAIIDEIRARIPLHADEKVVELYSFDLPVRVWAEPVGLREVLSNLVSNAIHHLDKPQGVVRIEYTSTTADHIFSVTDDGPGIPPELQRQVFQPFVRGPANGEHSGRGLGLFFVRQIVERHGGRVWIDSVPGAGSRFSFNLPQTPPSQFEINEVGGAE